MQSTKHLLKTINALQATIKSLRAENRALKSAIGHEAIKRVERIAAKIRKGRVECDQSQSSFPFQF